MIALARKSKWIPLIVILLVVIILTIPDFYLYPGADYGVYANGARLMLQGRVLYREYWDHKGPGIYAYLALWQSFFGSSWWSIKASLLPIYSVWGLAVYKVGDLTLKKPGLSLMTAILATYYVLRLGFDPNRSGAILVFSTAFDLLALYALIKGFSDGLPSWRKFTWGVAGGSLSGIAFLIRQTSIDAGLIAIGSCCFFLFKNDKSKRYAIYGVLGGGILMVFGVFLAIWVSTLTTFLLYDRLVFYNSIYSASYVSLDTALQWRDIFMSDQVLWVLMLASIFATISKSKERIFTSCGFRYTVVATMIAVVLALLALKPQSFYRIQYLPYLLILAVFILAYIWDRTNQSLIFHRILRVVMVLFVVIYLGNLFILDVLALRNWYTTASSYQFKISNYPDQIIAQKVKMIPDVQTLFVLGNRPWIYMWSGLTNTTPYYYTNSLFAEGYLSMEKFDQFFIQFQSQLPDVIVVWPNYPTQPDDRTNWNYITTMNVLIERHYQFYEEVSFENWQVWPYRAFVVQIFTRK